MWRVQTTAHSVRFWASVQLAAILTLLAMVSILAAYAIQSHDSLCSFKGDLADRHENTVLFIAAIRTGQREPIQGISVGDLVRSERAQAATLRSLGSLDCTGFWTPW